MENNSAFLDELARVFAVAAVESALQDEKSRRSPDKEHDGFGEHRDADTTPTHQAAP
jgi:hypothetical protein